MSSSDIVTVPLQFPGQSLSFQYPRSGNIDGHLRSILAGTEYPLPMVPKTWKIESIVDVGANVGAASLWFLSHSPDARVICFEPAYLNHKCLVHNLTAFPGSEVYACGLHSEDRQVLLHHGASQCMQHSIFQSLETGSRTETIQLRDAAAAIDELGLERISVLKVDTEGCEVPILERLGDRLNRVDVIYIEWHSDDDRRRIDELLSGQFLLSYAEAKLPHRGNACYLSRALAAQVPEIDTIRIG